MSSVFDRPVVLETRLEGLPLKGKGKVRDIYDLGDSLLIVATDRISAFDVVLPNGRKRCLSPFPVTSIRDCLKSMSSSLIPTTSPSYARPCITSGLGSCS